VAFQSIHSSSVIDFIHSKNGSVSRPTGNRNFKSLFWTTSKIFSAARVAEAGVFLVSSF